MADTILSVRNLDMHFPKGRKGKGGVVKAVDDVSFDVIRGETFGIVGESGSGKTTLGRAILRIIDPTGGAVAFNGKGREPVDVTAADKAALRRLWQDIRMVFQDPQSSLNPRLPVIELVGQCLRASEGLSGQALADRVSRLLLQVGLRPEVLHRYAGAFSGGQRQRIGIARALAPGPELVIADEAVSALDVSIQAQTLNLLQDLQEEFDLTYVFIAHDLAVVEHICDRVAVMYRGRIVELAPREALFSAPAHPYTRALLEAAPVPDPRARKARRKAEPVPTEVITKGCAFAPRCAHAQAICRAERPPSKQLGAAQVLCHFAGEI
ncbi:ABC transporter ATP-binding protein [Pseudoruegeria sp. SHC-113]|uniref:ABC transporter ATP-binding protein n=1 Tax=Pseudoruegeria sp. SHC-113 TaxID=2855439 RepID=UPI0021BBB0E3|nr:ABC transporter ATP-binding protein [Pseudoruegeria sp. SHC-113]MCT8161718.1 ABC transporter ATP-binding protein [Pseudoruegeria sp. SHC-113]